MADKKGAKEKEKVTQKTGDERKTALDNAIARIEKDFGKGSVMKLGESQQDAGGGDSHRLPESGLRPGRGRTAPGPHHRNLRAGIFR